MPHHDPQGRRVLFHAIAGLASAVVISVCRRENAVAAVGSAMSSRAGAGAHGTASGAGARRRQQPGIPVVRAGLIHVTGVLSPEAVRRVVLRNLGQIRRCYDQGLAQNPALEGRVVIQFIVGPRGAVQRSNVAESSVAMPSVGLCMAAAVARWAFPAPEGGSVASVLAPFIVQHPE